MNGKQLAAFLCDAGIGFSDQPALLNAAAFRDELLGRHARAQTNVNGLFAVRGE